MVFGLPAAVVGGACAGISASFFTIFELETDSPLAQALFKTKLRTVCYSSIGSFLVGYLVNPLAGMTFEIFYYPACYYKSVRVQKSLKKLESQLKIGESGEILCDGRWSTITKVRNGINPITLKRNGMNTITKTGIITDTNTSGIGDIAYR